MILTLNDKERETNDTDPHNIINIIIIMSSCYHCRPPGALARFTMLRHELRQENPDLAEMVEKTRTHALDGEGVETVSTPVLYTCTVHLYCTLLFINRFCDPGGVHRGQDGAAASLYQAGRQATPASKKGIRILENKHFNDSCELLRFRLP